MEVLIVNDPKNFWFEHVGRHLNPEAQTFKEALMAGYPHAEKNLRTRMGGSEPARFLVTRDGASVFAPIKPFADLPDSISLNPTSVRRRRDWVVDVILAPPDPPFLAASVGMSSADADHWRMTTDANLIALGGAGSMFEGQNLVQIDRHRFLEARDWFAEEKGAISDLLRSWEIKKKFQTSLITGREARSRFDRLKTEQAVLQSYPGAPNPVVAKLVAFSVQHWEAAA